MYRCRTQNHTKLLLFFIYGTENREIIIVFRIKYQKLQHQRHKNIFNIDLCKNFLNGLLLLFIFSPSKLSGYQTLSDESHMLKKLVFYNISFVKCIVK